MATESIRLSAQFPVNPKRLYDAWLSSEEHSAMTGSPVVIDPIVGGRFDVAEGFAQGETLWLEEGRRIVQSWRAKDCPEDAENSTLEVSFDEVPGGTLMTIHHSNVPAENRATYESGWNEYYLEPMRAYFAERSESFDADDPALPEGEDDDAPVPAAVLHVVPNAARRATPRRKAAAGAPSRKTTTRKTTTRKSTARKTTTTRKPGARKTTARKSAAKTATPARQAGTRKTTARKPAARKSTTRKTPAGRTAKPTGTRKTTARKSTTMAKTSTRSTTTTRKPATRKAATRTTTRKAPARKPTAGRTATSRKTTPRKPTARRTPKR